MTTIKKITLSILMLTQASLLCAQVYQHDIDTKVGEYLQSNIILKNDLIEATKKPRPYEMQEWLYQFYQRRNFQPAWVGKNGLKPLADSLVVMMEEESKLYETLGDTFEKLMKQNTKTLEANGRYDIDVLGQLEVHLTRAFIYLADVNLKGYILPSDLAKYEWFLPARDADLAAVLEFAIMKEDVREGLTSLLPKRRDYWSLVNSLATYEEIQTKGGWGTVHDSITNVELGDKSEHVASLKKRLAFTEWRAKLLDDNILYDEPLASVVGDFQKRHGLKPDGKVGDKTLEALNVPVEKRIAQLKINIERYKWLPEERGRRHIWVNIPDYMLYVYQDGEIVRENIVVVGSKGHKTPLFSSRLMNLVINPYWNVPISIARNEILPKLKEGTEYLDKQRFDVIDLKETLDVVNDKKAIDWTNPESVRANFRFRQKPGPGNSLGRIKFNLIRNDWGIYLHDTPSKSKFELEYRAWSHGCIRVKDPVDLAASIIQDDFNYNREQIQERIDSGKNQRYEIKEEIPVHLVYMTAWVDTEGVLHFRDDVYGKDKMHEDALSKL